MKIIKSDSPQRRCTLLTTVEEAGDLYVWLAGFADFDAVFNALEAYLEAETPEEDGKIADHR